MSESLDMNMLPEYVNSSFRYFERNERHVNRIFGYNVLLLVFEGTLRFSENSVPVEVHAGEYYIQKHGLLQEGTLASDAPKYYYIHFNGSFTDDECGLNLRGSFSPADTHAMFERLEALQSSGATQIEKSAVFYSLLSLLYNRGFTCSKAQHLVADIKNCISTGYTKRITLDEICRQLGYGKNHIMNVFKRETGITVFGYVDALRLENAKRLILSSEKSMAQIAAECGFESYINLYKAFLKAEKKPPGQWAEEHGIR